MVDSSTTPVELAGVASGGNARNRQADETLGVWSFAFREQVFSPRVPQASFDPVVDRSAAANTNGPVTASPRRPVDAREQPVSTAQPRLGKRGFVPTYQWEGVVEALTSDGFRARLRPLESGIQSRTKVEYADFDLDDLADSSDVELVAEDAIFYWTVGRSRNSAGTYTNTSLVRFRRVPVGGRASDARTQAAADALLKDLGEPSST